MGHVNSAQNSTNGSRDGAGWTAVTSIPLSEEGTAPDGQSVGALVRDATTHLSTLVRSEVELAKTELAGEAKKAVKGSVYFILALTVLGFSLFFLFFTLAEGLAQLGLWRWASFGIVFLLMLVVAGLLALLGYRRVRKIRAPKRTIESLKETSQLTKRHKDEEPASA
ncbi:phage holin family protein [Saccharopolyspora oryzae]|uniref:Phage holin family protein n=1 Tax=Saccharopolyspora oryzae TaxID=2997343 RepID=A0ABT4UUX7_9PSEU|nr:phage holin family protein [Saccharopolyspora oryzae]MDA3624857.1 phage holin family protein [Saccharopolyspora oryzae]